MVWIRYARIRAIWRCFTTRGYTTKYHVVGVAIKDEYEKKPTEDIDDWVKKLGNFVVNKMCENSCQSLSTSVYCDKTSAESETIYTSETLITKEIEIPKVPEVPEIPKVPEVPEVPRPPRYILEQIEYLQKLYKEAESIDEKMAIREEMDKIKKRYAII